MSNVPEALQAGLDHHRAGRLLQAEHMYRRVLQADPRNDGAVHLLGLLAFQAGKHELAVEYLREAIKMDRFRAPYHADLGEVYRTLKKMPEALAEFEEAAKLNPEVASVQNNLGLLYRAQGRFDEAVDSFHAAIDADATFAEGHRNLGAILQRQGQTPEARAAYERAVRLAPDDPMSYFRLGTALQEQGKLLEAIACYHKSLRLQPGYVGAIYQCAVARLALGEFAGGWPDFEMYMAHNYGGTKLKLPFWNGAPLDGRKVYVHARYSPSNALQFLRYLPQVRERGGEVYLDVRPELLPLLQESGYQNLVVSDAPPPECDVQTHLMSLPRIFHTTVDTIPTRASYVSPAAERVSKWQRLLQPHAGYRVGIAWQGEPEHPFDHLHRTPLENFAPLAGLPGVTLFSLLTKPGSDELAALGDRLAVVNLADELHAGPEYLADLAAIMANLDLVITSDNVVAHLAGALGVKVWVALSVSSEWCWLREREVSPWYPSMRLFRQADWGQWSDVFARLSDELALEVAAAKSPRN